MSGIIFLMDQHERTIGHLSNEAPEACPYYKDKLKEDLETGAQTYEFYIPADHPDAEKVLKNGFVVRPGFHEGLMQFQITRIEEEHADGEIFKFVFCEFAWAELNGEIVRPYDLPGTDAETAVKHALSGTRWQPGNIDFMGNVDLSSGQYDTALKMIHDTKDAFDAEVRFRVTMQNGEITGRYVDLVERVGANEGKTITFEKNLVKARRIHDRTTVATALIGLGKGDEAGNQLTFTAEVWRKADGKPVDKPAGLDWVGDPEALEQWGIDGRHIIQVYEYNTTNAAVLLQKTWEELQRRKNGLLQYEAEAALLDQYGWDWERSAIGDTTLIQDLYFNPPLMVNARIITLERSFTDPLDQAATFGDYEPAFSEAGALAEIQSTLLKKETQWETAPDGMRIERSATAPTETDGVIWVQPATGTRPYDLIRTYNPQTGTWEVSAPMDPDDLGAEATIFKQSTAPQHQAGRLWLDTSKSPNVLYRSTGTTWQKVTPTAASEVGADPEGAAADAEQNAKEYTDDYAEPVIYKQATGPAHKAGRLWLDTSRTPNVLYRSTGSAWVKATPTAPGEVGADPTGTAEAKANAAQAAAIQAAALDATEKANAAAADAKSHADTAAAEAQTAAENVARAEAEAAETAAKAHADGIVTAEEQARIDQAAANLAAAKTDATTKANAAEAAAKTYAESEAEAARAAAVLEAATDAQKKADAAQLAAENLAKAEATAAETTAKAYADGIVDDEEAARIAQANANLTAAKNDATAKANAAQQAAIDAAAIDAKNKADAAQAAAEAVARAEADTAETVAKAYADGIVDDEEAARIAQANANLQAAKDDATKKANDAKAAAINAAALDATSKANAAQTAAENLARAEADAAETAAKAHADGIVDAEEQARIDQANANLTAAKNDATAKANAAEAAAKSYADTIAELEATERVFDSTHKEFYNFFSFSQRSSGITGDLYIYTKIPFTSRMYQLDFKGYNYVDDQTNIDFSLGFYAYSTPSFNSKSFTNKGNKVISRVRGARDANGNVVLIITPKSGNWYYPAIVAERMSVTYQSAPANIEKNWTASIKTVLPSDLTLVTDFPATVSESEAGAHNKAKTAEYESYQKAVTSQYKDLLDRANVIINNSTYYTSTIFNSVNTKKTDLVNYYNSLNNGINSYTSDGVITSSEENVLSTRKADYEAAAAALANAVQTATQDAGGLKVGTLSGITVQVDNAGMSSIGDLVISPRIWAGASFDNRYDAPFKVRGDGVVIAEDIRIGGGSININNDITVGNQINLGNLASTTTYKYINFNNQSKIYSDGVALNLQAGRWKLSGTSVDFWSDGSTMYAHGNLLSIETTTLYISAVTEHHDVTRFYDGISINDVGGTGNTLFITDNSNGQWTQNYPETGLCGIGSNGTPTGGSLIGTAVMFRVKKNYTPSSVSTFTSSGNRNPSIADISGEGFWLYLTGTGSTAYYYWRGTYNA